MIKRTHYCGEVTESLLGSEVAINGWLDTRRDHGGVIFLDIRDKYGKVQVVFDPEINKELHETAHKLRSEFVRCFMEFLVNLRVKHNLHFSVFIADVEEYHASVIAPGIKPAVYGYFTAKQAFGYFSAIMGPFDHIFVLSMVRAGEINPARFIFCFGRT